MSDNYDPWADDDMIPMGDVGDDLSPGGGKYLSDPGIYHMLVVSVEKGGEHESHTMDLHCEVLAGSVPGQQQKTHKLRVFKQSSPPKKSIDRTYVALGMLDPRGPTKIPTRFNDLVGRQLVMELEEHESDKGKKFLRMAYANIYHPLDEACSHFDWMDKTWLARLVDAQRTPPVFPKASDLTQQPATSAAPAVDLDAI